MRGASKAGLLSGGGSMRTLYRILSVLTLSTLISGPVLTARAQDDQSFDPQADNQATQSDQQYEQNQDYDRDENSSAAPDRVAPDPQDQRAEDQPLETPQYEAQNNSEPAAPD